MRKINYLILPVLFFGFIYFMFLNQYFKWKVYKNKSENRTLAKFPEFNVNKLDKFPEEFDAYLNDNFTYRGLFLGAYHEAKFVMGVTPNIQDVIVGSNGNYFLAYPDQKIYSGEYFFDKKKLRLLEAEWRKKQRYLDSKDIPFYWLVAPNKHHVYPENLPMGIYEKGKNRSIVLKAHFDKTFPLTVVYPLNEMLALKDKQYAYYKQDNHWAQKGAFIAYQEVMKLMHRRDASIRYLSEKEVQWKPYNRTNGNLLNFLGKEGELSEMTYVADFANTSAKEAPLYNFKVTEGFPYPWEYERHYTNPGALNAKRVLIIRDSFGENMIPFFNETFSETLYIFDAWKYAINKQIVERYKPDLIIFLTLETNVGNILEYEQVFDKE